MKTHAAKTYNARAAEIRILMGRVTDALKTHAERASADPEHWGFAGDLAEIKTKMGEVLFFLTGNVDPRQARV